MTALADFASAKLLPIKHLERCGLKDGDGGIGISYGNTARARFRKHAATSHPTFWLRGDSRPIRVYGHDRVSSMAAGKNRTLLVVEGESDCLTAWFHRRPAIGIPGASMSHKIEANDISWAQRLVVVREPGAPGVKFVIDVARRARECGFAGEVVQISLTAFKDLSELHVGVSGDSEAFASALDLAISAATSIPVAIPPTSRIELARLADIQPEAITWLWRYRIARGKVTMVVGDPGDGKSYMTLAIAAAVTRGTPLPDGSRTEPADVIVWNGEDGLADTIRVRAERVGADLTRLYVIQGARDVNGQETGFGLHHLPELVEEVQRRNVGMVVLDPVGALLAGVDAHKDAEVRSALQPLADAARKTGTAIVAVAHLNKNAAQRAIYRIGGSIGFVGLARSVLLVARDHETGRRAVVQLKSNLAEQVQPVEFRIDDDGLWFMGMANDLQADRLLADPKDTSALNEARLAIMDALNEADGEISGRELDRVVREAGISEATYKRARAALNRENLIERRGGNRHQRELKWAISSPTQSPPRLQTVSQTKTVRQTTDESLCESSTTTLNHNNEYSRARARENGTHIDDGGDLLDYASEVFGDA